MKCLNFKKDIKLLHFKVFFVRYKQFGYLNEIAPFKLFNLLEVLVYEYPDPIDPQSVPGNENNRKTGSHIGAHKKTAIVLEYQRACCEAK